MHTIDPTMSFAQMVQYYKDYVKRTKGCGRKPVSFLRFITGRYQPWRLGNSRTVIGRASYRGDGWQIQTLHN